MRECIEKLLENPKYEYLFFFKVDINETFPPRVYYEILDPYNKTGLDLSVCQGLKNIIGIPSGDLKYKGENIFDLYYEMKKLKYNLFDKKDKFYHDICTPFTYFNDTDITLADRRKEFFELTDICTEDCKYLNHDENSKTINILTNKSKNKSKKSDINYNVFNSSRMNNNFRYGGNILRTSSYDRKYN